MAIGFRRVKLTHCAHRHPILGTEREGGLGHEIEGNFLVREIGGDWCPSGQFAHFGAGQIATEDEGQPIRKGNATVEIKSRDARLARIGEQDF